MNQQPKAAKVFSPEFEKRKYKSLDGAKNLAKRPVSLRLPVWADSLVRGMTAKERVSFLREAVIEALDRKGLLDSKPLVSED
jgi:hypothetical protein